MKKRILILILNYLVVFSAVAGGAVKWSEIDRNAMSTDMMALGKLFQQMRHYKVDIMQSSYEDYTSEVYHERTKGYFERSNEDYHDYTLGIHTIQSNGCRTVIDSAKRILIIGDPTSTIDSMMPESNYKVMLKLCTSIKKAQNGNFTYYRMEFKEGYVLSAYEFTMEDKLPSKIVMYYSKKVKKGGALTKPRMEIIFSNWKMNPQETEGEYDIQKYLIKSGNSYALKAPYAGKFKLLDQRVKTRNDKK